MSKPLIKIKSRISDYIPLSGIIFLSLIIISFSPLTNDSFLHITLGKFIMEKKSIPTHYDISYKQVESSLQFLTHSWLSDIFIYLTQNMPLIFLSITFIIAAILAYKILSILNISPQGKIISLSLVLFPMAGLWKLHPLVFLPIFMLLILFSYLSYKIKNLNYIWILPLIFLGFANFIGGFIALGGVFLGSLVIIETVIFIKERHDLNKYFTFLIASVVAISASIANPSFLRIWTYVQTAFSILTGPGKSSGTLVSILATIDQSFVRTAPSTYFYVLFLLYLLLIIILFSYFAVRNRTEFIKVILPFLPLSLFLALAFTWIRFVPLVWFMTLPLLAIEIDFILKKNLKVKPIIFSSFIIVIVIIYSLTLIKHPKSVVKQPRPELSAISKMNLPENLFSTYDFTDYVFYYLYPKKVYIDAQDDFFDENDLTDFYIITDFIPGKVFDEIANNNQINTVIAAKALGSLGQILNKNPGWVLVYFNKDGYVFVRKTSVSMNFLEQNSLNYLDLTSSLGVDSNNLNLAKIELEYFIKKFPDNTVALGQLATIYRIQDKITDAESTLEKIPEKERDFTYYTEMGRVMAAQGKCEESESNFLKVFDEKTEQKFSRAVLDLGVLYAGCFGDKDKAKHYFQRYLSFVLSPGEKQKVRQLAKDFGVSLDDY